MRAPIPQIVLSLCAALAGPASAAAQGELFKAPGATLHYEVRGAGRGAALMVVNGGPGVEHGYLLCSDVWDRLAASRKVIFYDQRGTGKSAPLTEGQPCGLAEQIEDLEALRAHLGLEKMDLLGHSWGGYLVMAYAARHPERIAHLIICDSAAPRWDDTIFLFKQVFPETTARQDALDFATELGDPRALRENFLEYLSMLFYSPEKRDAYMKTASADGYNKAVNEKVGADLKRFDLNPELPKFRFPALVLTGRHDMNVAPAVAWKIHQAIPGSRFQAFEKSGHMPFYEEPEAFRQAVEGFLGGPADEAGGAAAGARR